jgi:sec-independent protein translocase protein TatA
MPGPWELIIIFLIIMLIFGAKRIPEIMGGVGKGIRTFKKGLETDDAPPKPLAEPSSPPVERIDPK